MKVIALITLFFLVSTSNAQQAISGYVSDGKGNPVMNANIYFEGSYEGTTSDADGQFNFVTELRGKYTLVASFIGYERYTKEILLGQSDTSIYIVLRDKIGELNEVEITAGIFSASDKKKSATLTSFDIATTSSAMGDIYGAYAALPGTQKVGEEGMLFVRGGDSYEVKTFMDGMLVQSPFYSKMSGIPTRGRYSPLLFSETLFSTGGYSSEYGQALSSIVDLNTTGLETENKASVALMYVGGMASVSRRWDNSSLALTGMYANNLLQHKLFKQNVDWIKDPVLGDVTLMYRKIVGETGMLKVFAAYNSIDMHMNHQNFEQSTFDDIKMRNQTLYINTTYTDQINEKWLVRTGVSHGNDFNKINYNSAPINTTNQASQVKFVLTNLTLEKVKTRMGVDVLREQYVQRFLMDDTLSLMLSDLQANLFLESEIKITVNLALRLGGRAEYSFLMEKPYISPRLAAAYKTGINSQLSFAYGKFQQKPGNDYLKYTSLLKVEKSDHYILNFQYRKNKRMLRLEAYVKQYDDLVKYTDLYSGDPSNFSNGGYGIAKGFEVFWRDRKTIKGSDYWISYSYLDTRRDYKDYPYAVAPVYASRHNLSLVYKHFITPLNTFLGFTYSFASGRPYNDKNSSLFMAAKTKAYNDVSLGLTHITQIFNKECVIHLNITNLFGFKNIYGYRYSDTIGNDGLYASKAIIPSVRSQAVLMLLISL
ncbi:carboxypeptidase-like regulatory domain-containing protein [Bacteroidota bacterium]